MEAVAKSQLLVWGILKAHHFQDALRPEAVCGAAGVGI